MAQSHTQSPISPDEALRRLMDGNKRFLQGFDAPDSFQYQDLRIRHEQHPYACILGCADSRVSPEHAFDESHGNLFVARVAGNMVTPEILASLEYGTSVLGASLIMVLGHSGCGAVHASIDSVSKQAKFEGHIDHLLKSLEPAILDARHAHPGTWMEQAVMQNVRRNVQILSQSEPVLAGLVRGGKLKVVGGVYHLENGQISLLDEN